MKNPVGKWAIEPFILGCWTASLAFLFGFHMLAGLALSGGSAGIDRGIMMSLRNPDNTDLPWGPQWLHEAMRDISGLGSVTILGLVSLLAAFYFLMKKDRVRAFYIVAVAVVSAAASNLLKFAYLRPRPDLVPHSTATFTSSFPSAHSMMSAVIYLTIGIMLARAHSECRFKIYFLSIALVLSLLIGFSRIYLGVHWPSDVLAGWIAGGALSLLLWTIDRKISIKAR